MLNVHTTFETVADAPGSLILLQEYNHRMFNGYATAIASLSIAASGIASAEGRAALSDAQARLHAVADVHRALQAPITGVVDVASYLEKVCGAASHALTFGCRLMLHFRHSEIILPAARAWRVGLILVELLTNAAKHGRPEGEVLVEMQAVDEHFVCSVVSEGRDQATRGMGAGHHIVDILADQIGGRLERRHDGPRFAVNLMVPVSEALGRAAELG